MPEYCRFTATSQTAEESMKLLCSLFLLFAISGRADWLTPSNPPPMVKLAWDASTNNLVPITNYFVYRGQGSRQYDAKMTAGTNLTFTVPGLTRGTLYFFAATAQDANGLESDFSNEISCMPAFAPSPPRLKNPIMLQAQTKPSPDSGQWTTAFDWSLDATQASGIFRLLIAQAEPAPVRLSAPLAVKVNEFPPIPHK